MDVETREAGKRRVYIMRRVTKSLATKLTACLVGSVVVLFGALGYLNGHR